MSTIFEGHRLTADECRVAAQAAITFGAAIAGRDVDVRLDIATSRFRYNGVP